MYMAQSRITAAGAVGEQAPSQSTLSALGRLTAALAVPALALAATLVASSMSADAQTTVTVTVESR